MNIESLLGIDGKMKQAVVACAFTAAYFSAVVTPSLFTSDAFASSYFGMVSQVSGSMTSYSGAGSNSTMVALAANNNLILDEGLIPSTQTPEPVPAALSILHSPNTATIFYVGSSMNIIVNFLPDMITPTFNLLNVPLSAARVIDPVMYYATPSQRFYRWVIPHDVQAGSYKIQVLQNNAVVDQSDVAFTIKVPAPKISVVSPSSGGFVQELKFVGANFVLGQPTSLLSTIVHVKNWPVPGAPAGSNEAKYGTLIAHGRSVSGDGVVLTVGRGVEGESVIDPVIIDRFYRATGLRTMQLIVVNANGASNVVNFTIPAPKITAVTPVSGSLIDELTFVGTNFVAKGYSFGFAGLRDIPDNNKVYVKNWPVSSAREGSDEARYGTPIAQGISVSDDGTILTVGRGTDAPVIDPSVIDEFYRATGLRTMQLVVVNALGVSNVVNFTIPAPKITAITPASGGLVNELTFVGTNFVAKAYSSVGLRDIPDNNKVHVKNWPASSAPEGSDEAKYGTPIAHGISVSDGGTILTVGRGVEGESVIDPVIIDRFYRATGLRTMQLVVVNTNGVSNAVNFTIPAPKVTFMSPSSGDIVEKLTFVGTNFVAKAYSSVGLRDIPDNNKVHVKNWPVPNIDPNSDEGKYGRILAVGENVSGDGTVLVAGTTSDAPVITTSVATEFYRATGLRTMQLIVVNANGASNVVNFTIPAFIQ